MWRFCYKYCGLHTENTDMRKQYRGKQSCYHRPCTGGGEPEKIIISSIEHLSVVFPAEHLQEQGYTVEKVPVDGSGFLDPEYLAGQVDEDTLLVSIAPINHEIGVKQDIHAIIDLVRDKDEEVKIHFDERCLLPDGLDMEGLGIDLASFSSHKVYDLKGVGALYVKEGATP